jgi:DNA-binding transcriptional regulator YdaS (Cro superfamily)
MNLNTYLSRPGAESTTELAAAMGVNPDQIRQWRYAHGGRLPSPERCADIERATEGMVTCEELRPGDRWTRIKDASWPWHPKGRPVLEITPAPAL